MLLNTRSSTLSLDMRILLFALSLLLIFPPIKHAVAGPVIICPTVSSQSDCPASCKWLVMGGCTPCDDGEFSPGNAISCTQWCNKPTVTIWNWTSNGQHINGCGWSVTCPAGQRLVNTSCTVCAEGTASNTAITYTGTGSSGGINSCPSCISGTYQPSTGQQSCLPCSNTGSWTDGSDSPYESQNRCYKMCAACSTSGSGNPSCTPTSQVKKNYPNNCSYTCSCDSGYTSNGNSTNPSCTCTANTIKINYNAGGGSGTAPSSPTQCSFNQTAPSCNAPSNTYTNGTQSFSGWKCTGGRAGFCDGNTISVGTSLSTLSYGSSDGNSNQITLTAQWCNKPGASTYDASCNIMTCLPGYYRNGPQGGSGTVCTACVQGSWSGTNPTTCTACQQSSTTNGTTTAAGQSSCNKACTNNGIAHVATWKSASWAPNTVTDLCTINTCVSGYQVTGTGQNTACEQGTPVSKGFKMKDNTGILILPSGMIISPVTN